MPDDELFIQFDRDLFGSAAAFLCGGGGDVIDEVESEDGAVVFAS